jgi:hypothetical protein
MMEQNTRESFISMTKPTNKHKVHALASFLKCWQRGVGHKIYFHFGETFTINSKFEAIY